ncbi:MAG TPA: hypothetical protein VGM39_15725 [Kofleriaceae bacterium]
MLDGLFLTPAVTAITDALASAKAEGALVVVGHPKLAKRLGATAEETTGLDAKSVDAVIGVDVIDDDAWAATLREWTRVVRDGGAIVTVDKGKSDEASRRALCAGLTEIEQRHAGRSIVTSGLVTHFD